MHQLAHVVVAPVVSVVDGQVVTTSLEVARVFGKRHDHVVRDIQNLRQQLPPECLPNFGEGSYTLPETGAQQHKRYHLTRDGFTLLAMGFTGRKALAFKLAYIDAFNRMEAELKSPAKAAHLRKCWQVANALATVAQQALFTELAQCQQIGVERFIVSIGPDGEPTARRCDRDALIGSLQQVAKMVADPGGLIATDAEIATLAKACTDRLASRIQRDASVRQLSGG